MRPRTTTCDLSGYDGENTRGALGRATRARRRVAYRLIPALYGSRADGILRGVVSLAQGPPARRPDAPVGRRDGGGRSGGAPQRPAPVLPRRRGAGRGPHPGGLHGPPRSRLPCDRPHAPLFSGHGEFRSLRHGACGDRCRDQDGGQGVRRARVRGQAPERLQATRSARPGAAEARPQPPRVLRAGQGVRAPRSGAVYRRRAGCGDTVRPRAPIPGPLKAVLNRSLAAMDGVLSRGYGTDGQGKNLEVHEAEAFDEAFDEFFEKVATVMPCVPEKDAAFLKWRYGPGSPQYPARVLVVRGGRGLLGYTVLKTLHTGEDGFVMDLTVLPGHREAARALLRESVRYFRKSGVHIIRYRYLPSPTSPDRDDLRRLGFFHRRGRRNWLLVRFADERLHALGMDATNWSYNVGDGEATFWIR